jgi:hypothetical protein
MSETRYKYPRTPHLPTSPGFTPDDVFSSVDLAGDVVMTEKMDGECTTLYRDGLHARSIDSKSHPSREWVKTFHATIAHEIPEGMRICGENLYAQHSIHYEGLRSYFQVFSIWQDDRCLSWAETLEWCALLGLAPVPTIYEGPMLALGAMHALWPDSNSEGYVIRTAGEFTYDDFAEHVAKWVRPNHVQTSSHWMRDEVRPNHLGQGCTSATFL